MIALLVTIAVGGIRPAYSYFSRTTSVSGNVISFGTWGPSPSICRVCPIFGVSGVCSWAVFLYGSNLREVSDIKLVKGTVSVPARKIWHIGDCILYCVFDLRGVPAGSYDIVAKTSAGTESVVYNGFQVLSLFGGGGEGRYSSTAQSAANVEDPQKFDVSTSNNDPSSIVADVRGPIRSSFESASLVADGVRVDGSVEAVTKNGLRVRFARSGVEPGTYDLVVNRSDDSSLLLESSFAAVTHVSPMKVTDRQPASGTQGQVVQLKVTGLRLELANGIALVQGGNVIQPAAPVKASPKWLAVAFDLALAVPGPCDLYVSCVDGTLQVLQGCFTVVQQSTPPDAIQAPASQPADQSVQPTEQQPVEDLEPEITLTDVAPRSCNSGTLVEFTATGSGLTSDLRVKLVGGAWWGWSLGMGSASENKFQCMFDLKGVPAGSYRFVLVRPDRTEHSFEKPIQVLPAPQEVPAEVIRRSQ